VPSSDGIHSSTGLHYGRKPRDFTRFAPRLEDYLAPVAGPLRKTGLPPATGNIDRATKVSSWPMYCNGPDPANPPASPDGLGDCTCAAIGHMIQAWTAYAGTEVTVPASEIITLYSAVSGYDPATGANDNGAAMQDVLDYMKSTGITDSSGHVHKVVAYAAFGNPTDETLLAQVLDVFGTVYSGIACPESAQTEFGNGPWTYVPGSPIEGGHAICLQRRANGGNGIDNFVTWGALQPATRGFVYNYMSEAQGGEAWAVVTQDWVNANGTTVLGMDLSQLISDMQFV
jgi:hypothetical protein